MDATASAAQVCCCRDFQPRRVRGALARGP